MTARDHRRVDADADPLPDSPSARSAIASNDHAVHLSRGRDVGGRDLGDALTEDVAARDPVWKASRARIAAFAAASNPSTSAVGSASAYPVPGPEPRSRQTRHRNCPSCRARSWSSPLTIPSTFRMWSPASDSRIRAEDGDGTGDGRLEIERSTPAASAAAYSVGPSSARERLVGRDHGCAVRDRGEQQRACRIDAADDLDDDVGPRDEAGGIRGEEVGSTGTSPRSRPARRTAIPIKSRAPARAARSAACSTRPRATAEPTTPQPIKAT